jgi:hypothetical protein
MTSILDVTVMSRLHEHLGPAAQATDFAIVTAQNTHIFEQKVALGQ